MIKVPPCFCLCHNPYTFKSRLISPLAMITPWFYDNEKISRGLLTVNGEGFMCTSGHFGKTFLKPSNKRGEGRYYPGEQGNTGMTGNVTENIKES